MNVTHVARNDGIKDGDTSNLTPRLARDALRAQISRDMKSNDVLVSLVVNESKKRKSKNKRGGRNMKLVKEGMKKTSKW